MDRATKIIIGVFATTLLAGVLHFGAGNSQAFVDRLEKRAGEALTEKGIGGVDIAVQRKPLLTRNLVLSGDESQKSGAIQALENIPGIGTVKWAGDSDAVGKSGDAAAASAEAIAECQSDIDSLMTGKTISFRSGSAYLAPNSKAIIAELGEALKPCSGMSVEVQGHTDLTGAASINQSVSQARADAVMNALIVEGIPAEQLTAKGYGASQPIENAKTSAANAKNRRTVFKISAATVQGEK